MAEFIDLSRLQPTTWHALGRYASRRGYDEWLRKFTEPQWAAWLVALLKVEQGHRRTVSIREVGHHPETGANGQRCCQGRGGRMGRCAVHSAG